MNPDISNNKVVFSINIPGKPSYECTSDDALMKLVFGIIRNIETADSAESENLFEHSIKNIEILSDKLKSDLRTQYSVDSDSDFVNITIKNDYIDINPNNFYIANKIKTSISNKKFKDIYMNSLIYYTMLITYCFIRIIASQNKTSAASWGSVREYYCEALVLELQRVLVNLKIDFHNKKYKIE